MGNVTVQPTGNEESGFEVDMSDDPGGGSGVPLQADMPPPTTGFLVHPPRKSTTSAPRRPVIAYHRRVRWVATTALLFGACADRSLPIESEAARDAGSDPAGGPVDFGATDLSALPDMSAPLDLLPLHDLLAPLDLQWASDLSPAVDGGNTGFGPEFPVSLPSGIDSESVAIGDVTGDGRADVVVGGWATTVRPTGIVVLVFAQQASGQLDAPVTYFVSPTGLAGTVALGDLNGDGRLDVAVPRQNDVAVLFQNASGTLDLPQPLAITQLGTTAEIVAIADLDGDGRDDLLSAGWAAAGIDVFLQTAQGTLAPSRSFACPHPGFDDIAIADFNGDGRLDVALAGENSTAGCMLLQQPGGFAQYQSLTMPFGPLGIEGGDVNGDGRDDLVAVGNGNAGQLGVAAQASDGTLSAFAWTTSYDIPNDLLLADVDLDGRKDALVVHTGWARLGFYYQDATGLAAEQLISIANVGWGTQRMAVGDVNSDGRPDIALIDAKLRILYHH
jgi:hypothetical protein